MSAPVAAVTGGTGFLGRYVVAALAAGGWRVRLLARRPPVHPLLDGLPLEVVPGALEDAASLARLVRGATAVVHAAGLVRARDAAGFLATNRDGAARLAAAVAREAPGARVVLVSSQAAREPSLSPYAVSKRAGEAAAVAALGGTAWVVVRPGVVYGPWDREALALFRLARLPLAPVPRAPEPRLALVHARDAAGAIAALCRGGPAGAVFEIADDAAEGHGWGDILRLAGAVEGRRVRLLPVPDAALWAAGLAAGAWAGVGGRRGVFGPGKVAEILHRDWRPDPALRLPPGLWRPAVTLEAGLRETLAWWRGVSRR